jgi:hypothetical protein
MKSVILLFSQLLLNNTDYILYLMSSSSLPPTTPKELWCFACNSIKITCLHNCSPEHCNMCDRIKAILIRTNGLV